MPTATAIAHPNIALVKYWGKAPGPGNVPAGPSLSITLDTLVTQTRVSIADRDALYIDDAPAEDTKVRACLADLRAHYPIAPLRIETSNNFPTAAGLASSASGFAALVTAIDHACDLGMDAGTRSRFARRASGSAGRSIFGGVVALSGPEWTATPILAPEEWPLQVVVAITHAGRKNVSSSVGMRLSERSPYYPAWVASTAADFTAARTAVMDRDFSRLAEIAEHSCLKMHGLMLATPPGLLYWNAASTACLHAIRALRETGSDVFFTMDAGPQVKAVCLPESTPRVARTLAEVPGVQRVLVAGLGDGARIIES